MDQRTVKFLNKINDAQFYSVLRDEVTDVSNWEQLSVVLRYVDQSINTQERYNYVLRGLRICNRRVSDKKLTDLLKLWKNMRGQGYDGGSGTVKGVQGRILSENSTVMYVHCAAHCLNLSIVNSCQISTVRNIMYLLKEICILSTGNRNVKGFLKTSSKQRP